MLEDRRLGASAFGSDHVCTISGGVDVAVPALLLLLLLAMTTDVFFNCLVPLCFVLVFCLSLLSLPPVLLFVFRLCLMHLSLSCVLACLLQERWW